MSTIMDNKSRILIILDIETFILTQLSDILRIGTNYNLSKEELDYFFDWCVNQILTDAFSMHVIHHYRHDIYLCIYSEIKNQLIQAFRRCINKDDLRILKNSQVKTLVNDKDLFITRRFIYEI